MENTRLYVKSSKKLRMKLRDFFIKDNSYKEFSLKNNVCQNEISRWVCGKRGIPISILYNFSNSKNKSIYEILDNEMLSFERSPHIFRFSKNISIFESNFLGWFLSEGNMEKEGKRITITQNNKNCLINMEDLLKKRFNLSGVTIIKDRGSWALRISNAAFCNYIGWRYNITSGKKSNMVRVPNTLSCLTNEHKFALLAGYIEGDGCFCYNNRANIRKRYKVPRIFITSTSLGMLKDLQKMYNQLGITSTINKDHRKQKYHHNQTFKLTVSRIDSCIKLAFYIYPYLFHPERKENIIKIFCDKELLSSVRINNCKTLLNKFIKTKSIKKKELSTYFSTKLGYKAESSTVRGWLSGTYRPPFLIVLHCCKILDKNYFDYIPIEYSFLLLALNIMSLNRFLRLRKKYSVDIDLMQRNLRNQFDYANKTKAKNVMVIGPDEISKGKVKVKNMASGKEEEIGIDKI